MTFIEISLIFWNYIHEKKKKKKKKNQITSFNKLGNNTLSKNTTF